MTSPPGSRIRPGNRTRGVAGPAAPGGFTLVELLAVLAIISLLGALGAGAFHLARRNYALAASTSRVQGVIRAARTAAVQSGVPSRVVVDTVTGEVSAYGFETVGEWGFEESDGNTVYGARRAPAVLGDGASLAAGHSGKGLSLGGRAHADCGALAPYDLRAGVFAEAWILSATDLREDSPRGGGASRRAGSASSRTSPASSGSKGSRSKLPATRAASDAAGILGKGSSYFLGLAPDGSLEGRIGDYRVRTAPGTVLPGRWTRVALWYDGDSVELLADGIERDTYFPDVPSGKEVPPPPASLPLSPEPLVIGSRTLSFTGVVDEVKVHGLVEPLRYTVEGPRERFLGWRKVIHFDRKGRLHPRHHETGLRVILASLDEEEPPATKTSVAVDYSVTYADYLKRRGLSPADGGEAREEDRLVLRYSAARQTLITIDPSGAVR